MYKKILMAYDGGPTGREVLRQGADFATTCHARVILLTVVPYDLGITLVEAARPTTPPACEYERAHDRLQSGAQILRALGLEVGLRLAAGDPPEVIAHTARTEDTDLIVVGERPRTKLARWWSGDTAASLVPDAPCSVLVTRTADAASAAMFAA